MVLSVEPLGSNCSINISPCPRKETDCIRSQALGQHLRCGENFPLDKDNPRSCALFLLTNVI